MGKRKSRAKPPPKKRMDKLFTTCDLEIPRLTWKLPRLAICRICQESFSTTGTALTEPVDIYSEWIDECAQLNTLEDDAA